MAERKISYTLTGCIVDTLFVAKDERERSIKILYFGAAEVSLWI